MSRINLAENSPASTVIYKPRLQAGAQYTLRGLDAADFDISPAGVVTLKVAPDFEIKREYSITLETVFNGHLRSTAIDLKIKDLNDSSPVFVSPATGVVTENTRASIPVYLASAVDADSSPRLSWSLGGTDAGLLKISRDGAVTLKSAADYETRGSYSFDVVVNDGVHTASHHVDIAVQNINDNAPVFTSGASGVFADDSAAGVPIYTAATQDADGDTVTYALAGADAALLDIAANGDVSLKDPAQKGSYDFTVLASDGAHNTAQAVHLAAADMTAPQLAIVSSASLLDEGESATITFTFTEDPGSTFTGDDIAVAGGTLGELSGSGVVRTATFTAAGSANLNTGASISVAGDTFTDAAGNEGSGDAHLNIATVSNKVLFVGNSATFARVDPVMSYNTYDAVTNPGGVHDLTSPDQGGTFTNVTGSNLYEPHNWGGVPGLVDKFAQEVGLNWDVSISARNAATLKGHYTNSSPAGWDLRGNIASDHWDMVVLQDQTDEPLPGGRGSITFAAGSSTASLIVTPTGDSVNEYDETLALTLAASDSYKVATSAAISGTILNDDPNPPVTDPNLPTVSLVASPGAVAEDGSANLVYTFTRAGPTTSDLVVTFTVFRDGSTSPSVTTTVSSSQDLELYNTTTGALAPSGGSGTSPYRFTNGGGFATSGNTGVNTTTGSVSFTSNTGTITIKAGQTSASLTMDPHADANVENDESVRITLTHPGSGQDYNIGTAGPIYTTIVNDDFASPSSLPAVTLSLSSAPSVYESAGQNLVYTFTRSGDTSSALTVNFTEDGTATYFAGDAAHSDFGISSSGATQASLTTTSGKNADIASFEKYAGLIEDYVHAGNTDNTVAGNTNADAQTNVYLYATWPRPDMIAGAWDMLTDQVDVTTGPNAGANGGTGSVTNSGIQAPAYFLTLEDMTEALQSAYEDLAIANADFKGVAPVGEAFLAAVQGGYAIRDPYSETASSSVDTGAINLWFDDNLHASKYGSYLAGLTLFETLSGLDAQVLGAQDPVAQDLGIDAATAVALQRVASATAGFDANIHWSGPSWVGDLGGTDANATLATAGAFTFGDDAYSQHSVSVEAAQGNLGTMTAAVRSDGNSGQVDWTYTVNNQAIDSVLAAGEEREEQFTVTLDDGHGHVSVQVIGVMLVGT